MPFSSILSIMFPTMVVSLAGRCWGMGMQVHSSESRASCLGHYVPPTIGSGDECKHLVDVDKRAPCKPVTYTLSGPLALNEVNGADP